MTGDKSDILGRLRGVLPTGWFADATPVLDGLLGALAWSWSWFYGVLAYVRAQTRIATASDLWLDLIAYDFFGNRLSRGPVETDAALRIRIQRELNRERGTRAAIVSALRDLTGRAPVIFEPARASDTGGYGSIAAPVTGLGYGLAGGWGSLALPFQAFVTAYRPAGSGVATVAGYGTFGGGYGTGAIEYADIGMIQGAVTDADIMAAIAGIVPAATVAWTQITN